MIFFIAYYQEKICLLATLVMWIILQEYGDLECGDTSQLKTEKSGIPRPDENITENESPVFPQVLVIKPFLWKRYLEDIFLLNDIY